MKLTFLGKDSTPSNSPTLYATDEASYVVQGWIVSDPEVLAGLAIGDDETVVEVPARLLSHLVKDGLSGDVTTVMPPIVHVKKNGNYIVQGARVNDPAVLAQMNIPDYETCVQVQKHAVAALVGG